MEIGKTITQVDDYRNIKLIDLDEELRGTTDEEVGNAEAYISFVERKVVAYIHKNYHLTYSEIKEMCKLHENAKENFVIAICDHIEDCLHEGKKTPISEETKGYLRIGGFMNM